MQDGQVNIQKIKLNLLPVEYRSNKRSLTWIFARRFVWPSIMLIVVVVSLSTYWIILNDEKSQLEDKIVVQNSKIDKLKPVEKKVKSLKSTIAKIDRKNKALLGIQFSKTRWINIFQDMSSVIPSNSWLTSVKQVEGDKELLLVVHTYQFADVAQYMIDLEKRKSFKKVDLQKINTMQKNSVRAFTYEIKLHLDLDYLSNVEVKN